MGKELSFWSKFIPETRPLLGPCEKSQFHSTSESDLKTQGLKVGQPNYTTDKIHEGSLAKNQHNGTLATAYLR